ncbi:hypothetical protein JRO89_XS15G0068200 [Xanthoceras sorbifolium]|uniref:Metallo-beta-lactamase domain-containing protein n=1 Tax=Xanthoceras sorbifolium TaxID=99658 RepID=A0ABQ8H173_9ROSI|nr:hypothetical protein JRO89_XS15G0068200 [Xanthoceras sorbifolium]
MLPLRFVVNPKPSLFSSNIFSNFFPKPRTPLLSLITTNLKSQSQMASYTTSSHVSKLLFRQLFEKESSTYTYLLADVSHPDKPALLIDPVDKTVDRDLSLIKELGLKLIYAMNTHVHADHVTGTGLIKNKVLGVKSVISKASCSKADMFVEPGDQVCFGNLFLEVGMNIVVLLRFYCIQYRLDHGGSFNCPWDCCIPRLEPGFVKDKAGSWLSGTHNWVTDNLRLVLHLWKYGNLAKSKGIMQVRATPGHTLGCVTYVTGDGPDQPNPRMAFTGDALLIRGCGRTDFQGGSSTQLYKSVHSQARILFIFTLPKNTLIYPGHDYRGFTVSSVGEEMEYNPRLTKDEEAFKNIMENLKLSYPKMMDIAVPANLVCGIQELTSKAC